MHYLLIARFTMDDIPLRLYGAYDGAAADAEADAKAIHADPTLLDTKWKRSVDKWPLTPRGDFVGAIVLSFADRDGYPRQVTFDSTAEAVPTPPEPAPAPPEPSGLSRATDNGTSLASAARSLDAENADLRRRVAELEAENSIMAAKNAELYATNVAYSRKNDELRALNEDLNHRLNATKARAERATDLEGKLRGTAQLLLAHFQRLEERTMWAVRFADDSLMHPNYGKAMWHCERKFAEEFQGFLHMYPHVLPDIPAEYWPNDDTDDEMND